MGTLVSPSGIELDRLRRENVGLREEIFILNAATPTHSGGVRPFKCPQWKVVLLVLKHPRCASCGVPWSETIVPSVDHIVPKSKGGSHDLKNLQLLCKRCNSAKGTKMAA